MSGKISTITAFSLRTVSKKFAEFITKHPNISMLIASIVTSSAILIFPDITPKYCDKIAIRTMLTNTVGLFALLTFATNQLSNISRKTKDGTYLGVNIKYFLALQSPHTHIISGNIFRSEIILLFIFPVLAFEFPTLTQYVTRLWWGIFSIVASLLAWNLVASLRLFGMTELQPESVQSQINSHHLDRWCRSAENVIKKQGGDPYYAARIHDEYLKNYVEIDPDDRRTYKHLTLGNFQPIDTIVKELSAASPPEEKMGIIESLYRFIYGRQEKFIEHLHNTENSSMQSLLFDLILETDSKYRDISLWTENTLSGSESVVPLTEFPIHEFPPQTKGVELIPAFVYHKISHGISKNQINPTVHEQERLIISINSIQNQTIKEYVAKQLVAALVKANITDSANPTQLQNNFPELPICLSSEIDPLNDDDIMWKTILTSLCERLLTKQYEYSITVLKTLLKYTSVEFRIAHLFMTLFGKAKMSFLENRELLEYYSQIITRRDLHNSSDSALSGLDSETLAIVDEAEIDFERTKKIILRFPPTSETFEAVRSGTKLTWLLEILPQPITYDTYVEYENRNFGTLFDFSTVMLWKEMVHKDELAFLYVAAECLTGVFFNDSQNRPKQQDSDDKGVDNAKMEVSKAASMLEQLGRTEDARRLRQSIGLK